MSENNKNRPVFKSKLGLIEASVWENNVEKDGNKSTFLTITLSRSYKDKEDNWKNTNTLRVNDILNANLVLEDCFRFSKTAKQKEE